MYAAGDTIVAVATPPGRGSIGVVRLSGPSARAIGEGLIGQGLEARRAAVGRLVSGLGDVVHDHVVVTWFATPHSYTGEDVVELSTHGNPLILDQVVAAAIGAGARHAMPGEFTFRAYLNDKIDLVQAEAVADLIEAMTPAQARAACDQLDGTLSESIKALEAGLFSVVARLEASLDFPDEGFHFIEPGAVAVAVETVGAELSALLARAQAGRVLREGLRIAIVGRPNVGKSSLFNALVGSDRAIVTPVAGTTRDVVAAPFVANGIPCEVVDTAGLRDSDCEIELEGMRRTTVASAAAAVVVVVVDGSVALTDDDRRLLMEPRDARFVVINKVDVGLRTGVEEEVRRLSAGSVFVVSAVTGRGVAELVGGIAGALGVGDGQEAPRVTNRRHAATLGRALEYVASASAAVRSGATEEFVLADLRCALDALQAVTGRRAPDAVLSEVFARFCVGK